MAATFVPKSLFLRAAAVVPRSGPALCSRPHSAITSSIFATSQRSISTAARTSRSPSSAFTPSICALKSTAKRSFTSSNRVAASATGTAPSQQAVQQPSTILTWDRFLGMRGRRRWVNVGFAVAGAVTIAVFGSPLIGALDLDTSVSQATGVDPLVVIGAGILGLAALGWVAGRIVGSIAFSMWARQRGWSHSIAEKEKSLLHRIKRYRADPTNSSPQNPIPDYYGEKIGSVHGYRKWLRDQRTFTKKMYRGVR